MLFNIKISFKRATVLLVYCKNNGINPYFISSFQIIHFLYNIAGIHVSLAFSLVRKPSKGERMSSVLKLVVSDGVLESHNSLTSFCFGKGEGLKFKINNNYSKSYGVFWHFWKGCGIFRIIFCYLKHRYPFPLPHSLAFSLCFYFQYHTARDTCRCFARSRRRLN